MTVSTATATATVVKLGPHLDVRTVGKARDAVDQAVRGADCDVVLDMSAVESIDAAGLAMLTSMHRRCSRAGVRLVLHDCQRDIRRVLAVTRLHRILHVDRTDGLRA